MLSLLCWRFLVVVVLLMMFHQLHEDLPSPFFDFCCGCYIVNVECRRYKDIWREVSRVLRQRQPKFTKRRKTTPLYLQTDDEEEEKREADPYADSDDEEARHRKGKRYKNPLSNLVGWLVFLFRGAS